MDAPILEAQLQENISKTKGKGCITETLKNMCLDCEYNTIGCNKKPKAAQIFLIFYMWLCIYT